MKEEIKNAIITVQVIPQKARRWLKERGLQISHEWIYQHILTDKQAGGDLYKHMRCQKRRRIVRFFSTDPFRRINP